MKISGVGGNKKTENLILKRIDFVSFRRIRPLVSAALALLSAPSLLPITGRATPTPAPVASPGWEAPVSLERVRALFAGEYENHAWGYQHRGWYIDPNGDIYTYRYSARRITGVSTDPATASVRYAARPTKVGHIDARTLAAKRALIPRAVGGKVVSMGMANDAGTYTVRAFVRDPAGKRPAVAVPLYQAGDTANENTAPAAKALSAWLRTLRGISQR